MNHDRSHALFSRAQQLLPVALPVLWQGVVPAGLDDVVEGGKIGRHGVLHGKGLPRLYLLINISKNT